MLDTNRLAPEEPAGVEDRGEHPRTEFGCLPCPGGTGRLERVTPLRRTTGWRVRRAWPDETPGEYVLEVLTPGRPGVRGAHLRQGHFELIPLDDPGLPALRAEAQQGEVISYLPYKRAVIRAEGHYIKIFADVRSRSHYGL